MNSMNLKLGTLFLIPSSIEQNENVSFLLTEQKKNLKHVKYFIVENEKIARKTIKALDLNTKIQAITLYKHRNKSNQKDIEESLSPIFKGNDIGLLSDSGSPCVADPGSKIVEYAHINQIKIKPLIGPSSIILGLMASGFNGQKFKFHGYIPIKKNDKDRYIKKMMLSIKYDNETQIFIETPYRNNQMLKDLLEILNHKNKLCVAINLTGSEEKIISDSVINWQRKNIDLDKKLCIFFIN